MMMAGIAAICTACAPSVNPFYTEKDIHYDTRLLGEWTEPSQKAEVASWKFEAGENKIYKLTVTEENGKQGQFAATLFKIKTDLFLDLIPLNCDFAEKQADLVGFATYAGHLLVHVSKIDSVLEIQFCDYEWLDKYLEKNPKALRHRRDNDRLLLTADTSDLQMFVLQHLGEGELFQKSAQYHQHAKTNTNPSKEK